MASSRYTSKLVTLSNDRHKVVVMRTGRLRYHVKVYDKGALLKSQLAISRRHAFAHAFAIAGDVGIIPRVIRFATSGRTTEIAFG